MKETNIYKEISNTIRGISIDAINKANSGHPGLPLGCADITTELFTSHLNHNPNNPEWINRDKFVLSAGHGSMLLYSILHLTGYPITLEDLKNFRQLNSMTPGHPELEKHLGIETTTGPLGQGIAHAVGIALSQKIMAETFNTKKHQIFTNKTYVLAGDGCLMEGISSEACSFAGHLNLNNLILIYDSNDICLDGPTSECFTENIEQRFNAYNWNVLKIDGHERKSINAGFLEAKNSSKPTIMIAKTKIGFGSPNRVNSSEAHGKPFGIEEGNLTKDSLNINKKTEFYISKEVKNYFNTLKLQQQEEENLWNKNYDNWKTENKELSNKLTTTNTDNNSVYNEIKNLSIKPGLASRSSSQVIIQSLYETMPNLLGGSADLSCSDSTYMKHSSFITKDNYLERNIKFGVREFAMSAIAAGITLSEYHKVFIGTFLTFSDYMKNGIRLTALMNLPVIYQFTHDSILLGEDGPTHQPIEQLASLRSTPNLTVIRPADTNEVKGAWISALKSSNPTALILSRQNLAEIENSSIDNVEKGAYIIKKENENSIDFCIIATGSELLLATEVANECEKNNISVRVISFPSWELFENQSKEYKEKIFSKNIKNTVIIEAQSSFGWHKYCTNDPILITVDTFGKSAPGKALAEDYGFTKELVMTQILNKTKSKTSV